jgi:predicted ATP-dependent protease
MLRAEVADSIAREGWFHVWPVTTVDEAMTLLTGVPAPQLNARVQQRLQRFHAIGGRPGNGR